MMFRLQVMAVSNMRVMCGLLVAARFVMLRRFFVVRCCVSVMFSGLLMVFCALMLSHSFFLRK